MLLLHECVCSEPEFYFMLFMTPAGFRLSAIREVFGRDCSHHGISPLPAQHVRPECKILNLATLNPANKALTLKTLTHPKP